jgi:ferrous iron transport protein B
MTHMLLVGNPNCGKTTLFNALTGDHQRVGNWPGVTVEKKTGLFNIDGMNINVTDLPGVYSLVSSCYESGQDEQITSNALATLDADVLINVIDSCYLERHLYLTSQLLELGRPLIVVLNMNDLAEQRGISIDEVALSEQLGCPVVTLQAHRNVGLDDLSHAILKAMQSQKTIVPMALNLSEPVRQALGMIEQRLLRADDPIRCVSYYARRILEGDSVLVGERVRQVLVDDLPVGPDVDVWMADARYQAVHQVVEMVQKKRSDASEHLTAKIDRIVLHRFWALPIFFSIMYAMFFFAIHLGGAFQDFFDISSNAIFVQGTTWLSQCMHLPDWLTALLAQGVGKGINTTLTFIPVMASMFFFLSLLESSGYMARAAFVVDKVMRILGLPGKSFVPMIVGFGCNVPAIMAARTLESEQDRLLTVLMSPFMSCSARLAIYAVFVAAFFPYGGQNIVFSLYFIGILMAVLTGLLLRNTLFLGQPSPLILELPSYHQPSLRRLLKETSLRLRHFILRSGKMILPVCVVLGGLNAVTIHGGLSISDASSESLLSLLGQALTPLFSPMGLHQDNWPATVGLLSGMLAKEVVVGSLNTLYAQMGSYVQNSVTEFHFFGLLAAAVWSIPHHFSDFSAVFFHPIVAHEPDGVWSQSVYGIMYQHFDGPMGAYAYLLFILLYTPCVSTMAAIRQEASRQLMWFSISWSLLVAYAIAVLFYQLATYRMHPQQTLLWVLGIVLCIGLVVVLMRVTVVRTGEKHAVTNP